MPQLVLEIEHLHKTYGKQQVLQDLNLHIWPGEIYGLLGPNGAGKTTTINIIGNLVRADRGIVRIGGRLVSQSSKRLIGVSPQENLIYRGLSCRENLNFFASLYGLRGRQRSRRVWACLEAVSLRSRANTLAETLSGGMQRRLSMAISMIHQPKLLILDEPTTGLDIEARYEIWHLIRELQHQGITVLLTTHLLEEAERLCDRIGILKEGRILAEGTLSELCQWVPAAEVVTIQTTDEAAAIARAQTYGFTHRYYGGDLCFWLPSVLELREILQCFDGIPLVSISRQPVRLEHIYVEVTHSPPIQPGQIRGAILPGTAPNLPTRLDNPRK
ncbi:ABC transporter ATP-binding protein [Neosynechococcus sphagnicola]|uniref:ABC transporter ATP-binding protein n=1 Tax=Neosynechococcus sphagnicola TaxID=1501145 RepID=UPI000907AF0F|nr:ABC transporter ATP-binding protein [Neosynechococcus sphagnicola]